MSNAPLMLALDTPLTYLSGVGPKRAKLLDDELGLKTAGDLLHYFPYKHIDRTRVYKVCELRGDMPYVQLRGTIREYREEGEGRKSRLVATFGDGTGRVELVWFQGIKYIYKMYKPGREYIIFGKPTQYGSRISITHPDVDEVDKLAMGGLGLMPHYHTTEKMKRSSLTSRQLERLVETLLHNLRPEAVPETLTDDILQRYQLMPRLDALRAVHYPQTADELDHASYRVKFEELFYIQLGLLRYASDRMKRYRGYVFPTVGRMFNLFFYDHLPFQLTGAQKRVIKEMREDMRTGRQMNRLLQGDVGSGKTMVALMTMLLAIDNGFQACIMAPTEILAEQHLETFRHLLGDMPLRVELLTSTVKGKRREEVLEGLKNGEVNILVGTHALIEPNVVFCNLGLAVIDEQHRFGVAQRSKLWAKNTNPPHVLVMTATPIPRTLAMTLYGDLDVSVIDELPPGRKPITTWHVYENRRADLYRHIQQQVALGRQVYVVYPLIKESERADMNDLENGYEQLRSVFPQFKISRVHGKMKPAEKDCEMQRFASGETQILVATTVIEVGVNVPNASVMVIENAERFGLSQLHQLRGRVGRGAEQSYCILMTKYELGNDTRRRMAIMTETNDGFEIAEEDLKLRGPGDLEGTQQSGVAFNLHLADLAKDGVILQRARDLASAIIKADPQNTQPANALLWQRLAELRGVNVNWAAIS